MLNSANIKLVRVTVFLITIAIIAIYLYPFLATAFLSNIYINSVIILTLIFGLFYTIFNIVNLENDNKILEKFSKKLITPKLMKMNSYFIKQLSKHMYEQGNKYIFVKLF